MSQFFEVSRSFAQFAEVFRSFVVVFRSFGSFPQFVVVNRLFAVRRSLFCLVEVCPCFSQFSQLIAVSENFRSFSNLIAFFAVFAVVRGFS